MEYDYKETTSTDSLFIEKLGVRKLPTRDEPKPYSFVKVEKKASFDGLPASRYAKYPGYYMQLDWSDNSVEFVALNNLHTRRVRGKVEGIQHFTEALVEFDGLKRQLWSLLSQGLRTITRRKGGFKARDIFARGSWKQTPELYLLWQFAIAPLVSQINDTIEKLGKIGGTYYDRVSTGRDISGGHFRVGPPPSAGLTPSGGTARFTTTFKYTVNNSMRNIISEFLGLNRPLSAAWDLKGWSWAVDYFFNVGELISNLDGDNLTREVKYLSHSVKKKVDVSDFPKKKKLGKTSYVASWEPGKLDRTLKSWNERFGVHIVHTDAEDIMWVTNTASPQVIAQCVDFKRTINSFPNAFYPEFRFKPKPGTFQFANLASAIAITLRSFEWSDKNFLIKPHKR